MTVPPATPRSTPVEFGPFRLEAAEHRLLKGKDAIRLQNKTFDLLVVLVERAGHIVSKQDLLDAVWPETIIEEGVLSVHVSMLRKALGDEDAYIETIPKLGYRFVAPVRETVEPAGGGSRPTESAVVAGLPPQEAVTSSARPQPTARIATFTAAILVAITAVGWYAWPREAAGGPSSMAVLPFTLLASDPDSTYLEVGMADALITRLGAAGGLRIPPTAVIRHFADHKASPREAGQQLEVEAVLTGTIQRGEGRLRVNVQVTNVAQGTQLWTAQFDEPISGIFAMQDAISEQIAARLLVDVAESARGAARETNSVEAYELYLRGRESWARRTPASIRTAVEMFEKAVIVDPKFARAYAGIADAYALTASGLRAQDRFPKAKVAALRALELDERLADAHNALAFISYKWEWQWATTEREFRRAIELDPNYVLAHHWYGEYLSIIGRHDDALVELKKAQALDPFSTAIRVDVGAAYGRAGRAEEAAAVYHEASTRDPAAAAPYSGLWNVYRMAGREQEAFDALVRFRTLGGATEADSAVLKKTYESGGYKAVLEADLVQLLAAEARADSRALNLTSIASTIARAYAMLGDRERALNWLEEATRRRDDGPLTVRTGWFWRPYRTDPRFVAVEKLVGMPQ